jgi:hypothetical protein
MHLANMALHDGRVLIFDCIEFNPNLRWIDVMSEVAFVVMDLHHRGRPELARRFLNRYLERTGDYGGLAVLRYYLVYRALVRATVAAIRGAQTGEEAKVVRTYLELAERFTRGSTRVLCITHGVSGSGKTTVTTALLEAVDLIRVRSDIERKRLAGLTADCRSESEVDAGLYTPDAMRRSYDRLRELAACILRAGYPVVLDATFLDRRERDACRELARSSGVAFRILTCRAQPETLRERVVARERGGQDASEAGLAVLEKQLEQAKDLEEDELPLAVVLDTSKSIDPRSLTAELEILPLTPDS